MKNHRKRFLCLLLSLLLTAGMLPVNSHAEPVNTLTITVTDSITGEALTDAIIYVTAPDGEHRSVNKGDGTYLFETTETEIPSCKLHISCDGYYAQIITDLSTDTRNLDVALDPYEEKNTWYTFGVYYTADGQLPSSYCAPGSSHGNYGPSGDGTPLVEVRVDITRLRAYSDVYYDENVRHNWTTNNFELSSAKTGTADQRLEDCKLFWTQVKESMDFQSEQAFRATGLFDVFIAYSLKSESSWWGSDSLHLDGILDVEPPVYVIELYAEDSYFGGFVTDARILEEGSPIAYPTMADVLQSYENHMNQAISWTQNSGNTPSFSGTFIRDKYEYTVTVKQTNYNSAQPVEGSAIKYAEEGTRYYVAIFDMTLTGAKQISFTATYTDGLEYETVFNDQIQVGSDGDTVSAFSGNTDREGYLFQGWTIQGGDGTVYTDEQVQQMTLQGQDITFVASYIPLPKKITVTFHTNNSDSKAADVFRTYAPDAQYSLNADGTITPFYEIPTFAYETHNRYIFQGWHLADGTPMDWSFTYTEDTDVYAHWITVDDVAQEASDGKQNIVGGTYAGFALAGTQLRYAETDPSSHYDYSSDGSGGGLRFIAVLSEHVWNQILAIRPENQSAAEYGILLAKSATAQSANEAKDPNYQLQYAGKNVNGIDTQEEYWYVRNLKCSGLTQDHYNGTAYRLYTAVVTYKSYTEQTLSQGHAIAFLSRPYLRYYDANGLLRTHYSNYTEQTQLYHGCSASYNDAAALTQTAILGD